MKKLVIVLFFFFSALSFAQTREELNYYPLHVGDFWQYQGTEVWPGSPGNPRSKWIAYKKVISDTVLADGFKYFVIKEYILPYKYFPLGYKYVRVDSTNGIVYGMNFEPNVGKIDSLFGKFGDYISRCTKVTALTEKPFFDVLRKARKIEQVCISSTSYSGAEFGLGLGEVMRYYTDIFVTPIHYQCDLIYAKINGKEYGTYVSVEDEKTIPAQFSLSQNYPNPFNPETTINFTIPNVETTRRVVFTTLKVYDVLGREVATLVDEYKQAGDYKVTFNARHLERSREIQSGIYFYRLITPLYSITKKMLLIK